MKIENNDFFFNHQVLSEWNFLFILIQRGSTRFLDDKSITPKDVVLSMAKIYVPNCSLKILQLKIIWFVKKNSWVEALAFLMALQIHYCQLFVTYITYSNYYLYVTICLYKYWHVLWFV